MTTCKEQFRELVHPQERILDEDLASLQAMPERVRIERYNQLKTNEEEFLWEFTQDCPDFLTEAEADHVRGDFRLARLLIAASFYAEDNLPQPLAGEFIEDEMRAVVDFDRYKTFDVLSEDEIEEKIRRMEGEVYELVTEYSSTQLVNMDGLMDNPEVQQDVVRRLLDRYADRRENIERGLVTYLKTHGPEHMVGAIESAIGAVTEASTVRDSIHEELQGDLALEGDTPEAATLSQLRSMDAQLQAIEQGLAAGGADAAEIEAQIEQIAGELDRLTDSQADQSNELNERIEHVEALRNQIQQAIDELQTVKTDATDAVPESTRDEAERLIDDELERLAEQQDEVEAQLERLRLERESLDEKRNELEAKFDRIEESVPDERDFAGSDLVTAAMARLLEMDYIGRVDTSIHESTAIETPDGTFEVPEGYWDDRSEHRNERTRLEGLLDDDADPGTYPTNRRTRFEITSSRYLGLGRERRMVIEGVTIANLEAYAANGFDASPAGLDELLSIMNPIISDAEAGDYHHLVGIASPTGWSERARQQIEDGRIARTRFSRRVSLLLIDLQDGSVIFDSNDAIARGNKSLFEIPVDDERVADCLRTLRDAYVDDLLTETIRLSTVTDEHGYSAHIVKRAFNQLEADGVGEQLYLDEHGLMFEIDIAAKSDESAGNPGSAASDNPGTTVDSDPASPHTAASTTRSPAVVSLGSAIGNPDDATVGRLFGSTARPSEVAGSSIGLPETLIPLMELRTEAALQPTENEVETIYALSGSSDRFVDRFHSLASDQVIADATPTDVLRYRDRVVEQVLATRQSRPDLVIDVHTHPGGAAELSQLDQQSVRQVADDLQRRLPETTLVFGVHAISNEQDRERAPVQRVDAHRVRWSSDRREHEIGFYSPDGEPVDVQVRRGRGDIVPFGQACPQCGVDKDPAQIQYWPDGQWSCIGCAQERTHDMGLGPDVDRYGSDLIDCPQCGEPKDMAAVQLWDDGVMSCIGCAEDRTHAAGLGPDPVDRYGQGVTCPECGEEKPPSRVQAWEDGEVSCIECAQDRTHGRGLGPDAIDRWGLKMACPQCGEPTDPLVLQLWDDGILSCPDCAEDRPRSS